MALYQDGGLFTPLRVTVMLTSLWASGPPSRAWTSLLLPLLRFCFGFGFGHTAWLRDLGSQPEIKPRPLAMEVQSPNY